MCGIAAIVQKNGESVDEKELRHFSAQVRHRGPDSNGCSIDRNVGLAHQRLAIFDLSSSGSQPMTFKNYTIVFNGAIYNYLEIREKLEKEGAKFMGHSDTEVIIAAYDHWGESCVQCFNGMWAFVIYDANRNALFCSRDRFGIKPLYYWSNGARFCLASEIKQFTVLADWSPTLNRDRCFDFLVHGYHDHTKETLIENVFQVPRGGNLLYQLGNHQWRIDRYYRPGEKKLPPPSSFSEATVQFSALFEDAVRLRLRSDVPIGATLSGGLDSSAIVGTMHQMEADPVKAIGACFRQSSINEEPYMDVVAQQHGVDLTKVWPASEDFRDLLKRMVWVQDEPLATAGVLAQYLVFAQAKERGLKVMLDGQGADELLAGYDKFYLPYFQLLIRERDPAFFLAGWNFISRHRWPWWSLIGERLLKTDNSNGTGVNWLDTKKWQGEKSDFTRSPDLDVRTTSINLLTEVGLPILLHYEDRNSSAFGIESRLPFLDYRLVEFCLSMDARHKIRNGLRKEILRSAAASVLPAKIRNRYNKVAFEVPTRQWLTDHREWLIDLTLRFSAPIFNEHTPSFTRKCLNSSRIKSMNTAIRLLTFDLWYKMYFERNA